MIVILFFYFCWWFVCKLGALLICSTNSSETLCRLVCPMNFYCFANLQMVKMITLLLKGKRFRESGKNKNKFLCFEQLPWRILYISTFNALKWCITGRFSIGIVSESSQSTLLQWPIIHIYINIEFVPWSQNLSLLSVFFFRFSS